ncbi:MAG TPA: hypothetical protein VMR21_13810 [Vicinamibacteria bacterium]|nr:hypothetical protein [Vicinamibacteria bacterium]
MHEAPAAPAVLDDLTVLVRHVPKPVQPDELAQIVATLARRRA